MAVALLRPVERSRRSFLQSNTIAVFVLLKGETKMAYEERQAEHKRIVVETPNATREEVHSQSVRYPDRSGVSGAALAAIVVGVVALAAIIILFALNQQQDTVNENMTAQQQPPQTIVQQPAQQPPIIVQQPAPATQPAPVIINGQPAPASGATTNSGTDDSSIQAAVDKRLSDDPC